MSIKGLIGVVISTTGDEHRMGFLETCVTNWRRVLPLGSVLVITVDGDEAACQRAVEATYDARSTGGTVYRVGQPTDPYAAVFVRQGVAANKNTGLEILSDLHNCEHMFLSDDDIWPLYPQALDKHADLSFRNVAMPHSMVNWGRHRLTDTSTNLSVWKWPRGSMLYVHRDVTYAVGGMVEEFGPGGHEHVEYSQRIHNAGLTPAPFISPASYATRNGMGAAALWHAEDMARPGEPLGNLRLRRKGLTSIRREPGDWENIEAVMARQQGSAAYVGFRAHENGRASATLCQRSTGNGGDK